MNVRVALMGAAWSIALTACASQPAQTRLVRGKSAIPPCASGEKLVVTNTSREAVRLITEPWGDPKTSSASRGGSTEIGRVSPGTEATFWIPGNAQAIWIEAVDLPRNPDGSTRVVKGILYGCVVPNARPTTTARAASV